jgi:hypothetical protein
MQYVAVRVTKATALLCDPSGMVSSSLSELIGEELRDNLAENGRNLTA